jgi:hypothetical protein
MFAEGVRKLVEARLGRAASSAVKPLAKRPFANPYLPKPSSDRKTPIR